MKRNHEIHKKHERGVAPEAAASAVVIFRVGKLMLAI
jgi:hypothetical protein